MQFRTSKCFNFRYFVDNFGKNGENNLIISLFCEKKMLKFYTIYRDDDKNVEQFFQ